MARPFFKTAEELQMIYSRMIDNILFRRDRGLVLRRCILNLHLSNIEYITHFPINQYPLSNSIWLHYHELISDDELSTLVKMIKAGDEDMIMARAIIESKHHKL